jgi:hypothetical protein
VLPLLEKFNFQPATTEELIRSSETELGLRLPNPYVDFLRIGNGGEGFIGESCSILWDESELASLNASYESHKWTLGFLIFGSDGGGEAFGFDTRNQQWPIVQVPFVGLATRRLVS